MSLLESIRKRQKQKFFPVISELKIRSKKAGDLLKGRDPIRLVKEMEKCPIAGISVVTESTHFGGSMDLLKKVASCVSVPVLHKDFIKDRDQIIESKRAGSSAILIIASILSKKEIEELVDVAKSHNIEVLLEVHSVDDLKKLNHVEFDLLGINNRDIRVLETDDTGVELTEALIKFCPKDHPIISESSISCPSDVKRVKKAGVDGILVGTAAMLAQNIRDFLNSLISVGW
jgi:indole-3-glycerol phosphate synthase